jgi:hypothetical protein
VTLPRLICAPDAGFTDPSGDATEIVVATPLPSQPALDITKGYVTWDSAKKRVVFHTKVLDLKQDPPTGATGLTVEFTFTYDGVAYTAVAEHDATAGDDSFSMESPLRTGVGGPLTGSFDKAASEVRVEVPANFFTTTPKKSPVVTTGSKFTGFAITTRRDVASLIVPNADSAGSLGCPFVVGAQAATPAKPTTVPGKVDGRPTTPTGQLPATGLGVGLPLVALGLVLGALGIRRRRDA